MGKDGVRSKRYILCVLLSDFNFGSPQNGRLNTIYQETARIHSKGRKGISRNGRMNILIAGDWHSEVHEEGVYRSFASMGHRVHKFSWHQYFKTRWIPFV